MTKLIGHFYFKKTTSGNLIGEYSARHPEFIKNYAEAATRIGPGKDWDGVYKTTWCEAPNNECSSATLKITENGKGPGIFSLSWLSVAEPTGKEMFVGEAMLCDDILVGHYTDKEWDKS